MLCVLMSEVVLTGDLKWSSASQPISRGLHLSLPASFPGTQILDYTGADINFSDQVANRASP